MIELNPVQIVEIAFFEPFEDSKAELLQALYDLLPKIHKEPMCLNFELFIEKNGSVCSVGRWEDIRAYNLHKNMQYRVDFQTKTLPMFCKTYSYKESRAIVPPYSALSLLNESS